MYDTEHYHGVSPDEAVQERPAYTGAARLNNEVAVSLSRFSESGWGTQFGVEWEQVGDEITDSPIMDSDTATGGSLAIMHRV